MKRTKLLQQPDNDKIDLRNIIKVKKEEVDNGCHKLCNLTMSQCARPVIKSTTIEEEDVTFTRLILSLQH